MKLPESEYCTESSTPLQEYFFGVSDTGLIFEILRTKIYKDPVSAIVREISCNARDAHREWAQTQNDESIALRPVEITLPTVFSPYIKIKDFGPGISPDRMENIFCKYAASTKRNDNIQTGGFGLGCKTPFSYSDTFNIITTFDCVKRVYNAFIDDTRVGKVQLVSEKECDEPNGTTIIIPAKKEDFEKFIDATLHTTAYWDVRPVLSGRDPAPEYRNESKILEGKGWYIVSPAVDRYGYSSSCKPLALVDGVQYDLDIDSLFDYNEKYNADSCGVILQTNIRINFRIGELTLSASRDNIHFDERTKKVIKDRLEVIFQELAENIESTIKEAKTYTEACLLFNNVKGTFPSAIRNKLCSTKITWQDNKIRTKIGVDEFGKEAFIVSYDRQSFAPADSFVFKQSSKNKYTDLSWPATFSTGKSKIFIHDFTGRKDNTSARISRILIQHLFDENPDCTNIQLLCLPSTVGAVKQTYDKDLLKLLSLENINSVTLTKTQKEDIRKRVASSIKKATTKQKDPDKVYGYDICWGSRGGLDLDAAKPFDPDEEGIYVVLETNPRHITTNSKEVHREVYRSAKELLRKPIHAFSAKTVEELGGDWVTLWDALQEKATEIVSNIDKTQLKEAVSSNDVLANQKLSGMDFEEDKLTANTKISSDDVLLKYIKKTNEYMKIRENISCLSGLINFLKIAGLDSSYTGYTGYSYSYAKTDRNGDLYKLYVETKTKYPILFMLDSYGSKHNLTDINKEFDDVVYEYIDSVITQTNTL